MKSKELAIALALTLGWSGTAMAGSARIVTPRIVPAEEGTLHCSVVNASDSRTLTVNINILTQDGTSVHDTTRTIPPNESVTSISSYDTARHCVVEVTQGGRRNARVSLVAFSSAGNSTAAVAGQ